MPMPQFTATKAAKSATFQIFNIVRDLQPDDPIVTMYLDWQVADDFGTNDAWIRDQGSWAKKVRAAIRSFGETDIAQAVTDLGAMLNGKTELEREVMVAVKAFDNANGTTSTIDWGV